MQRTYVGSKLCMFKEQKGSPLHGWNEVNGGELRDEVRQLRGTIHARL